MNNTTPPRLSETRPEILYALTIREDHDGSIEAGPAGDSASTRLPPDPFRHIRNVAVGYNTKLSGDFTHAGLITREALAAERAAFPAQIDRLWRETPDAVLGILDFGERLVPCAADARYSQWSQYKAFLDSLPPGNYSREALYESRVREHLTQCASLADDLWRIPWAYPTIPGCRLFDHRGARTTFIGYPMPGDDEYGTHEVCRENDRVARPIIRNCDAVIVQAGYFEAQYVPGYDGRHWEAGMWDSGRLSRADITAYVRSHIAEAMRLIPNPSTFRPYCMATPYIRNGRDELVNQETWSILEAACVEFDLPIILWAAFQNQSQINRFRAWCADRAIPLPLP